MSNASQEELLAILRGKHAAASSSSPTGESTRGQNRNRHYAEETTSTSRNRHYAEDSAPTGATQSRRDEVKPTTNNAPSAERTSGFDMPVLMSRYSSSSTPATEKRDVEPPRDTSFTPATNRTESAAATGHGMPPVFPPQTDSLTAPWGTPNSKSPRGYKEPVPRVEDLEIPKPNYGTPMGASMLSNQDSTPANVGFYPAEELEDDDVANYGVELAQSIQKETHPAVEPSTIDYYPSPFMSSLALAVFFPTGFVAAGYDKEVTWHALNGDDESARSAAKKSLVWSWVSLAFGFLLFAATILLVANAYGWLELF